MPGFYNACIQFCHSFKKCTTSSQFPLDILCCSLLTTIVWCEFRQERHHLENGFNWVISFFLSLSLFILVRPSLLSLSLSLSPSFLLPLFVQVNLCDSWRRRFLYFVAKIQTSGRYISLRLGISFPHNTFRKVSKVNNCENIFTL